MERDDNLKLKYAIEEEIKYLQKNKGALTKIFCHAQRILGIKGVGGGMGGGLSESFKKIKFETKIFSTDNIE